MQYNYTCNVKDDDKLRESFNELTRKVFGFDFVDWYETGHWQDKYIPHVLVDNGKVVSNVSVNLMQFMVNGEKKNYIQIGTVMTDPDYRGQGLNRYIMEKILEEYRGKTDGIYLFGNDSVLEYYPKFGFRPQKEYEYKLCLSNDAKQENSACLNKCRIEKVDLADEESSRKLYAAITECDGLAVGQNPNDGFFMCDNLGLYQFWLAAEFASNLYYVPEAEAYVIAEVTEKTLLVHQIFGRNEVDMEKLADAFGAEITEVRLAFTPAEKKAYEEREYKEEDCTLFVMGEQLEAVLEERMKFPIMSHA